MVKISEEGIHYRGLSKDHIEKTDFQEISIAIVNWPISEFYGAFVCIIASLASLVQTSWPIFTWLRGAVDVDSKYKIVWGETWANGVPTYSWKGKKIQK